MMVELPMKIYSTGKTVINWSMVNGSYNFGENIVEVIANKMVEKIAKVSGNKRKERRLTIRLNGFEDEYECGTESFKKGSFLKNLIKKSVHKLIESIVKPSLLLPARVDDIRVIDLWGRTCGYGEFISKEFDKSITLKEIKNVYRKYSKIFHPDLNTVNSSSVAFEFVKSLYEWHKSVRIMMVDNCRKAGVDMEY